MDVCRASGAGEGADLFFRSLGLTGGALSPSLPTTRLAHALGGLSIAPFPAKITATTSDGRGSGRRGAAFESGREGLYEITLGGPSPLTAAAAKGSLGERLALASSGLKIPARTALTVGELFYTRQVFHQRSVIMGHAAFARKATGSEYDNICRASKSS